MTAFLLLSAGRGPQECAWALSQLLHRLRDEGVRRGLTIQLVRGDPVRGERPTG
ncbi:hypothetical protein AB0877_23275 [Micromonospora sp. NPDC047644]|uniref:hypothetical protein n=1 Tax=Micromonospora sp. NPDC047644 TaxID=3157203 RepID=UPI00345162F5